MESYPEVMTSKEAMEFLRMGRTAFYEAVADRLIPAFKVGREWRFRRSTLEEWMRDEEERTVALGPRKKR